jgi:hypothetical protein
MNWADGSKFEGDWNMDKRLQGKMTMTNKTLYIGSFFNEVFHGRG